MNTKEGYSKKSLTDDRVLLAGGGDKPISDFLSSSYKTLVDYYASTLFALSISYSPSWYYFDLTSNTTVTATVNNIRYLGTAITATDNDIVKMSTSSSMSSPTTLTRSNNTFTTTFTILAASSVPADSYTRYFTITHDGVTSGVISATIYRYYKVFYGKSTTTSLADASAAKTLLNSLSYTNARSKGSEVTPPVGNGTTEYWWFATPFSNATTLWNQVTNETAGTTKIGEFEIDFGTSTVPNKVKYYFYRTNSVAATLSLKWTIGK